MINISEKRKHFRLAAQLPLVVLLPEKTDNRMIRRISTNVSAGGVYFQTHAKDGVAPGQQINLRIAVPPAIGRFESEGVLEGEATVVRVEPLKNSSERMGVACEFTRPLQFA
jgi:hypothetical protein